MLSRTAVCAALVAFAMAIAPVPAGAVPVPLETCGARVALPCLQTEPDRASPLAAVARSGMHVIQKVWQTSAFVLF
jgi:hypothetical protein